MKVGILGSGDVGRKLADGLIEIGYEIKVGTRDPTKENIVQWVHNHATDKKASVGTFADAACFWRIGYNCNSMGWNCQCHKIG